MPSKYSPYWEKRERTLSRLVKAAALGNPAELDVADIRVLGTRQSCYGFARMSRTSLLSGSKAHAMALGKLVVKLGLC